MCLTRPSAVRGFHSPPDDACSSGTARGDVADERKPQSARKLAECRLPRQGRVESNGQLPRHGQLARLHSFGLTKCGASAALAATRPSPPLPARCPPWTTHHAPNVQTDRSQSGSQSGRRRRGPARPLPAHPTERTSHTRARAAHTQARRPHLRRTREN